MNPYTYTFSVFGTEAELDQKYNENECKIPKELLREHRDMLLLGATSLITSIPGLETFEVRIAPDPNVPLNE